MPRCGWFRKIYETGFIYLVMYLFLGTINGNLTKLSIAKEVVTYIQKRKKNIVRPEMFGFS